MRRAGGAGRRHGFTLVEVVVSLVVTALVASVTTTVVSHLVDTRDASRSLESATRRARTCASAIASDIPAIIRESDLFFARCMITSGGPGERDSLLMLARMRSPVRNLPDEPEGGDYEIAYRLMDDDSGVPSLWRRADPALDPFQDAGGVAMRIARHVVSLRLEAFDGEAWYDEWDSDLDGLPHAVRVTVGATDDDGRHLTWARRVVAIDRVPVPDSNQIAIIGSIALLQRMERLIASLDRPGADALRTETFRLRYADAEQIAEAIEELFSAEGTAGSARTNQQATRNPRFQFQQQAQQQQTTRTSEQLRVKANTQQNAVTVVAEPDILEQIRDQIENHWDLPLPEEAVIPKIYDLENSDPIKVRDLLAELFGEPEQAGAQQSSQGVGRLAGQFSFEAIPESGRLVVVAKSPDHLAVIDQIVRDLDKPQTVGLPAIVELKHASAEELAEQLNTLLAEEGTIAQLPRQESGLSENTASQSPFSQNTQQQQQQQPAEQDVIGFWWQQARPPTDSRGSSNLVGQIRLVPVWRQNAIMVLAPPEYRQSVVDLIGQLDQPGRQVLISAIILEISRDDATSLGLRWSSNPLNLSSSENAFSIGANANATENNFLGSLFDTSVLSANADLNAVLQALAQRTSVNILSEPKLFTSDNQEAQFFDGQDIAFPVSSTTTASGQIQQQFDYRAVGLQLRVRPRITPNQQVDLLINLELSAIRPGDLVNDLIVVDRRETTTQLIVRGGQTVVISGIFRKEDTDIRRKVPLLGDIPLLGALFTSIEKAKTDSELLLFITPIVVENTRQSDELNEPYHNRLEQLRGELGVPGVEG